MFGVNKQNKTREHNSGSYKMEINYTPCRVIHANTQIKKHFPVSSQVSLDVIATRTNMRECENKCVLWA